MEPGNLEPWALVGAADATLERAASQLRDLLQALAARLEPFPAFMNMASIQALEVQPRGLHSSQRGCVVVCPDGMLYELKLQLIPGPLGVMEADQVEELEPLELPPEEYIPYAYAAIVALAERLEHF